MKSKISGQIDIFGIGNSDNSSNSQYSFAELDELPQSKLLAMEKDMLGLYVSGHPLDSYLAVSNLVSNFTSSELYSVDDEEPLDELNDSELQDGDNVRFVAIVSKVKTKTTKSGDVMAFVTCEDASGEVELICFPKTFRMYSNFIFEEAIIFVDGRLNVKDDEVSIIASNIVLLNEDENNIQNIINLLKKGGKIPLIELNISQNLNSKELDDLREILKSAGKSSGGIRTSVVNGEIRKDLMLNLDDDLIDKIEKIVRLRTDKAGIIAGFVV
jgi:DNA polymerase-3 subunit alpha